MMFTEKKNQKRIRHKVAAFVFAFLLFIVCCSSVKADTTGKEVQQRIQALPNLVLINMDDADEIKSIRDAYDILSEKEKSAVTALSLLEDAETKLEETQRAEESNLHYSQSFTLKEGEQADIEVKYTSAVPVLTFSCSSTGEEYPLEASSTDEHFSYTTEPMESGIKIRIVKADAGAWTITSTAMAFIKIDAGSSGTEDPTSEPSTKKPTDETKPSEKPTEDPLNPSGVEPIEPEEENSSGLMSLILMVGGVIVFAVLLFVGIHIFFKKKNKASGGTPQKPREKQNSKTKPAKTKTRVSHHEAEISSKQEDAFEKQEESEAMEEPEDMDDEDDATIDEFERIRRSAHAMYDALDELVNPVQEHTEEQSKPEEVETVYVTQEDADNDVTVEEYFDDEDEPEPDVEIVKKRHTFFVDDRFD